jgi:hypothetical protein
MLSISVSPVNNTNAVKMESYIDIDNDGNRTKVTALIAEI